MKRVVFSMIYSLLCIMAFAPVVVAQEMPASNVEMADAMRAEGKIYVVVLVVVIVFTGLILYAFNTDRKLSRVEKELESLRSEKED